MNALKTERFIREVLLFVMAISIFPFMTLRVLVWKWHFCIRDLECKIKKDHENYQNIKY